MAPHTKPTALPRSPLTRERILRAAVVLADRGGLAALSMRRLAQDLGVEAMSLYRYVANKDDLLDGMVDLVFGEIGPPTGVEWQAVMRERAIAARAALTRHRWAVGLMESRTRPGPETLRHHEAVLATLREGGFSVRVAAHAYSLLDSYIYGFTLNEQSLPTDAAEGAVEAGARYLQMLAAGPYPRLTEFIAEHTMQPDYRYGDEFVFGLDLILDGLERVRNTPGSA
ncbi:MAG: TetR/AcrR family transcriptional regulator [Thermomicrobiales bacterium]